MRTPPWSRRSPTPKKRRTTPDVAVAAKVRVKTLPMTMAAPVVAATGIAAPLMAGMAVVDGCPPAAAVEVTMADIMVIVVTEADTVDKRKNTMIPGPWIPGKRYDEEYAGGG